LYPEQERQPVRLLTDSKKRAIPPMQFSDKLKYLHWDVLWVERNGLGLLSATLDKTVDGNLRNLSTRKAVMDPTSFPNLNGEGESVQQVKCFRIHYVLMPNLVELEIGLRSCCTISLSDIVDAAPNLQKLSITSCECHDVLNDGWVDDIWRGSDFISSSVRPHNNLRFLDARVSIRSDEILQKTVQKFPNSMELWIGPRVKCCRTKLAMKGLFSILQGFRSLNRLKWNRKGTVELDDLIENLLAAGTLMTMEGYELKLTSGNFDEHVRLASYCRRKRQLMDGLRNWPKESKCQISVSCRNPRLFGWADGKCASYHHGQSKDCYGVIQSFLRFVRVEGVPFHFRIPGIPTTHSLREEKEYFDRRRLHH
jgi:hypothetical protein